MGHVTRVTRRSFTAGTAAALAGIAGLGGAAPASAAPRGPGGPDGPGGHGGPGVHDLRAMWIASVDNRDWPSTTGLSPAQQRSELTSHLDAAVRRRLNTVYFQARPTADALWPSPYEPWSQWLTGTQGRDPGWDPLGFVVREAHRRGLQVEAWFNPYRISLDDDPGRLVPTHPARLHPEWTVAYGGQLYYNPGLPQVRRFVQDAMCDALARYDIDGVHWDDYFYPYPVEGQTFDDSAAYAEYGKGFPDLGDWRRHNVDLLVQEAAARVRRTKPWVRFGVSPFGVWRNASTDPAGSDSQAGTQSYDDLYADSRGWARKGWLDYVIPQLYWTIGQDGADYAKLARWWAEAVRGSRTRLYIGEALYKAGDPAQGPSWQDPGELSRHLTLCAGLPEVRGHAFFSAKEVSQDAIGAMDRVVADHYARGKRVP